MICFCFYLDVTFVLLKAFTLSLWPSVCVYMQHWPVETETHGGICGCWLLYNMMSLTCFVLFFCHGSSCSKISSYNPIMSTCNVNKPPNLILLSGHCISNECRRYTRQWNSCCTHVNLISNCLLIDITSLQVCSKLVLSSTGGRFRVLQWRTLNSRVGFRE